MSPLRRLLIEDILTLPANLSCNFVICFHASSPSYERLCELHKACECPLPIVDFKDVRFTQLRVIVAWNPCVGDIVDGLLHPKTFLASVLW